MNVGIGILGVLGGRHESRGVVDYPLVACSVAVTDGCGVGSGCVVGMGDVELNCMWLNEM